MGGYGSGRQAGKSRKRTTDEKASLDIRELKRSGLLWSGRRIQMQWQESQEERISLDIEVSEDSLTLRWEASYRDSDRTSRESQNVFIVWTECSFGGERPWLRCPVRGCEKRTAILYFEHTFGCRKCCNLGYSSQLVSPAIRLIRRMRKVKQRLGIANQLLFAGIPRPKGMHLRTYGKLTNKLGEDFDRYQFALAAKFGPQLLSPGLRARIRQSREQRTRSKLMKPGGQ